MGYYINCRFNIGKAAQIVDMGGRIVDKPSSFHAIPPGEVLICVVENGPFDAAAVCYNEREFEDFGLAEDTRPKKWVLLDKETVISQVPEIAHPRHGPFRKITH